MYSSQGSYSYLEFQETWKKPGIFKQVKNLEMAWDLELHLENLEFVLQVAYRVIISRAISMNRMTMISEVGINCPVTVRPNNATWVNRITMISEVCISAQ